MQSVVMCFITACNIIYHMKVVNYFMKHIF